ncbi:TOPRIM nucleotidyl transferase/hydrolase domain-containing protein [Kitasatospora cineracea]|uniref:TOPRIM nucleotidyl transferase/hydrolase domain-containing protein n=1 Tax=Kitasatospora cineracea TaxID=88074 RepID=UPI0036DBE482
MTDLSAFRAAVAARAAAGRVAPAGLPDSVGLAAPAEPPTPAGLPDSAGLAALAREAGVRTAVLLEGPSDLAAVEALAGRLGRELAAEGVCAVSMGGAMSAGPFAALLGPSGLGLRLTGLCDEHEQGFYRRGFDRAGAFGDEFFVCAADLEEEFIRALGVPRIEQVLAAAGDLPSWRTFARQPAQRDRSPQQRLRRFLGTRKGRKIRYGRLLAEALDPDRLPPPLHALFHHL